MVDAMKLHRTWGTEIRLALFFAEDFKGFLAEDAVAGDPAGDDGGGCCEGERGEVDGDVGFEGEVHGGAGFHRPGDEVGEEDADGAGDEAEDGELDGEDGGDAGAGCAEGFEDDDFADAAVLGAGDGGGEDDDAGEDGECGEELDDVDDLDDDAADAFNDGGDIDDGDGGIGTVEGALELGDLVGHDMNAAVPDDGEALERGVVEGEVRARVGVLTVGAGDGGDGRGDGLILRDEGDGGSDVDAEAHGHLLGDSDLRFGVGGLPPLACDDPGAGGQGVVPGEVDGAQGAAREVLELEVGRGDAIDGIDARGCDGKEFRFGGDGLLVVEQDFQAGDF